MLRLRSESVCGLGGATMTLCRNSGLMTAYPRMDGDCHACGRLVRTDYTGRIEDHYAEPDLEAEAIADAVDAWFRARRWAR